MHRHPTTSTATGRRTSVARTTLALTGALCLALVVAACGSSDSGSDGTATTKPAAAPFKLAGTNWTLLTYRATDGKNVTATGTATLTFAGAKFSGTTGCNNFSGTYKTSGDSLHLTVGPMTQKACPGGAPSKQESTLMASLAKVDAFSGTTDQMMLEGGGKTLLTYGAGPQGVEGQWAVTGINNGKDAVVTDETTAKLTASFTSVGTFQGFGGCNQLNGGYETSGKDGIKIGPLGSTMKSCDEATNQTEAQYSAALQAATTWEINGDTLTLRDDSGAAQVVATKK